MATLTGAARVALGPEVLPFYTDDDALAAELARCAAAENDPLWRMPLWRPYDQLLDSKVADINNVSSGGFAGSITAALFLRRFVTAAKAWLHFDIFAWNQTSQARPPEGGECQAARALYALLVGALRLSHGIARSAPHAGAARPRRQASRRQGRGRALRRRRAARGRRAAGAAAARALARRAARHRGAQGRARDRLRDHRGRLGLGPARGRRLCRLAAGECAARAGPGADPQGHGAAHARVSRARRSSCRRSRRCRSAAGSRSRASKGRSR